MSIQELTKDQATLLLATFRKPAMADFSNSAVDWKGKFVSNQNYMDKPYVEGGYVASTDGGVEITIGWGDISGMDDQSVTASSGYSFPVDDVRNWTQAAKATKDHLKQIISE